MCFDPARERPGSPGAEGATAPETLRQTDRRIATLWRAAVSKPLAVWGTQLVSLGMFDKKPGTGLPSKVENIGRSSLAVVRPQIFLIRDHFFTGDAGKWPEESFPGFIRFPVVSGYVLGLVGAYLQFQNISPSEVDTLKCVLDVHNHYVANELDLWMSIHFMMQQSAFKFGLGIGMVDVAQYLDERARTGQSQYILLVAISQMFLQYNDARTLKLNLQIFCELHGIPLRDVDTLDEIIERWDEQKQYSMNPVA